MLPIQAAGGVVVVVVVVAAVKGQVGSINPIPFTGRQERQMPGKAKKG